MSGNETVSISSDPEFLRELSEYLEVLSNPVRLKILKVIERDPKEINEIAARIDTSYGNTKKHIDQLVKIGLVKKEAGFGRETAKGIHPVWKFSLAEGGLGLLLKNMGVFSRINIPMGYGEIQERLDSITAAIRAESGTGISALHLVSGKEGGRTYPLKKDRVLLGRADPNAGTVTAESDIVLPDSYAGVTRISKPHAILTRSHTSWQIEDHGSSGGTYLNAELLKPMIRYPVKNGDLIDLAIGESSARFIVVSNE